MRLKRLDLIRFGRFTEQTIPFGEKPADGPDLHVVYGPNESGKSTALAAFLDLLFGIATKSSFNFLHPYPTMRIGAALEFGGGTRELVRIKRPQNSLLDGDDRPLSESVLLGALAGVDRASYQTMFSLDDETLEAGGESILASQGDLGELLFSASAGLTDLSRSLLELRAEADGFYKKHARRGELGDLKGRLGELKAERERIDTLASHYAQLIAERDRAKARYGEAIVQRGRIQARMDEIQRSLQALPRLDALRAIRASLLPLSGLPAAPPGWAEELPGLQHDEVELATEARAIAGEIERLSSELAAIVVDERATGLADRVGRLGDLRARHVTAEKDLPERRLQARAAETVIAGILGRIERKEESEPSRLILGASVVGALRSLIEARSGVEAALAAAGGEASKARSRLEEALDRLREAGESAESGGGRETRIASLLSTVAALRADDHAARGRLAARSREQHSVSLEDRIRGLRPWTGDLRELVELAVPDPGAVERWTSAEAEAQKRVDRHESEVERLTTEAIRLSAELAAVGSLTGVVGDGGANDVRAAREAAWASHRRKLDAASADAFEEALRRDDLVSSARLGHAADLAKLRQAGQALATLEAELGRAQQLREGSQAALRRVRAGVAESLRAMTPALPDDTPLPQLEAWLARRDKALEVRSAVVAAERDLREAEADRAAARDRLAKALSTTGIPHRPDDGLDALLAAAQAAINREAELRGLRDAVEDRRRDVRTRERDLADASATDRTWADSWAKACSACWLGEAGATPSSAAVREIIAAVAGLGPAIKDQAGLADRIDKMEQDQAAFAIEVKAIAAMLDLLATPGGILDFDQAVTASVQRAKAAQAEREDRGHKVADARERRRVLAEGQAVHAARKAEMTACFGVESLSEVGEKLAGAVRKAELEERAEAAAREIVEALRVPTITEAEQALDAADRSGLEAELAEQKARYDDQDSRSRELFSAHGRAVDQVEAVAGDDAVARIEERRRTTVLEIEEGALRYLRLRVGSAAAEHALRAYRDRHRSSMMARASDAFRIISRGAYTGLATQPGKDGETLFAAGADGSSKMADELSKGTRFQLYLSLRVAGYHEFARSRPPVPFIADDIMETFDDFRAEEAFRLLADMAEVGQVIYFTHHRHLCEIVQRVSPEAKIHPLSVLSVS